MDGGRSGLNGWGEKWVEWMGGVGLSSPPLRVSQTSAASSPSLLHPFLPLLPQTPPGTMEATL